MRIKKLTNLIPEALVVLAGIIFGYLLTFGTFTKNDHYLLIATKAWSDFASHIPLIRSFSLGYNFPPQYPLFPGEPIKYHFLFYWVTGILEKMGFRIDIALNILSFIGIFSLLVMIYFFAKEIFKSRSAGVLSVLFFLFNSSLSFIYFFEKYPLSLNSVNQIIANKDFVSFAPYGSGLVSAFWNLNIYTNQRHLAISYALSLLLIYLLIRPLIGKERVSSRFIFILSIFFGLSFFLHTAVFLMTFIIIFLLAVAFPKIRRDCFFILFLGASLALPQYIYSKGSFGYSPKIAFGYLVNYQPNLYKFLQFWIYNLGLSLFTIPIAFIISDKIQRKIIIIFFVLFLVGNLFQFSPEIAANHKFFNYFIIVGNMFTAYLLLKLWSKKHLFKPIVLILSFFLILGGVIDLFPIVNDNKVSIPDYEINRESTWIKDNTNPDSTFLNTTFLYDPASLVGRKIFQGWPYFAWSQGYDTDKRGEVMKRILGSQDKTTACNLLKENKIDYIEIEIQNPPDSNIPNISNLFKSSFKPSYSDQYDNYSIYNVKKNCGRT